MTIYHNRTIPDYYHTNTLIKSQPLRANTQLRNDDILIWYDVIYDEQLDHMIQSNGRPGLIVSTAHDVTVLSGCPVQHWPLFLFGFSRRMQQQANNFDDLPVVTCLNFSISKKQINRYLLLKLIEWFRISSFDHTWSGLGATVDLRLLLEDFEQFPVDLIHNLEEFKNHMQASVTKIPVKFFASPGMKYEGNSYVANQGDLVWTWNAFLGRMMSQSAVSLIAESIRYESQMVYTEKTIYAVHGLTFPIWIGGYQQAQLWAKKGFDTFDDIINHEDFNGNNYRTKSKYEGIINIFGKKFTEQIQNTIPFIIGSGAIGCELVKNLGMLGTKNMYLADPDHIEKSNLSRQFLFNDDDLRHGKAETASKKIKQMNPDTNVHVFNNKLCIETEDIFNDMFHNSIDIYLLSYI